MRADIPSRVPRSTAARVRSFPRTDPEFFPRAANLRARSPGRVQGARSCRSSRETATCSKREERISSEVSRDALRRRIGPDCRELFERGTRRPGFEGREAVERDVMRFQAHVLWSLRVARGFFIPEIFERVVALQLPFEILPLDGQISGVIG